MRSILDDATDPWGIKVTRVEVKNILPPRDIQEAMEKQMRAEMQKGIRNLLYYVQQLKKKHRLRRLKVRLKH